MKGEFLIWSRIQKNLIYVLAGIILGAGVMGDLPFSRVDIIVCVVALAFFVIEAFIHITFLIDYIRKLKLRGKKK